MLSAIKMNKSLQAFDSRSTRKGRQKASFPLHYRDGTSVSIQGSVFEDVLDNLEDPLHVNLDAVGAVRLLDLLHHHVVARHRDHAPIPALDQPLHGGRHHLARGHHGHNGIYGV